MCDCISVSVSHHCGGILSHFSLQHCFCSLRFVGISWQVPATALKSGWDLNFGPTATPWLFFLADLHHCPAAWPSLSERGGLKFDSTNTLVFRWVYGQINDCKVPRSCGCSSPAQRLVPAYDVSVLFWCAVFGFHQNFPKFIGQLTDK